MTSAIRILLLGLLFLMCTTTLANTSISLPNGELTSSDTDLSVKVRGGFVRIEPTWINGRWYFNPTRANARSLIVPVTGTAGRNCNQRSHW